MPVLLVFLCVLACILCITGHGRLKFCKSVLKDVQCTLDYPDPRLYGSRTEIIARAYNDLRMRVVAVDKKLLHTLLLNQLFCQLKIIRLLDKAVYHSAPLVARPVHSSWLFSPCSEQLVSAYGL